MYCSVCEMMLMPSAGRFCDCCGVCADSARCLRLVDQRHRCKETFAGATQSTFNLMATESSTTRLASATPDGTVAATPPQTPSPSPPPPPTPATAMRNSNEHLWVHGNLPLHAHCAVCDGDLDHYIHAAEPGLHGYRCCWCQRTVHSECHGRAALSGVCDFGEFRSMIIPPSCVEAVVTRGRRKIALSAPDASEVPDWRPLFVIGERDRFLFG